MTTYNAPAHWPQGWAAVMRELCRVQGFADSDDENMHSGSDDDLQAWCDDLEARIGLDVEDMRAAVNDYTAERYTDDDERSFGRAST